MLSHGLIYYMILTEECLLLCLPNHLPQILQLIRVHLDIRFLWSIPSSKEQFLKLNNQRSPRNAFLLDYDLLGRVDASMTVDLPFLNCYGRHLPINPQRKHNLDLLHLLLLSPRMRYCTQPKQHIGSQLDLILLSTLRARYLNHHTRPVPRSTRWESPGCIGEGSLLSSLPVRSTVRRASQQS